MIRSLQNFDFLFILGVYIEIHHNKNVGKFNKKFQPVRNKTNRENTHQRKQSHAQDNIYVVRQFAYVHGVAGISL